MKTVKYRYSHQDAILVVMRILEQEFNLPLFHEIQPETTRWDGVIPDVILRKLNKKYLVVEVGNTNAEKIAFYNRQKNIDEVRWYDRNARLVGSWNKQNKNRSVPQYTLKQIVSELKRDDFYLRDQRNQLGNELDRLNREKKYLFETLGLLKNSTVRNSSLLIIRCCSCNKEISLVDDGYFFHKSYSEYSPYYNYQVICKNCRIAFDELHRPILRKAIERLNEFRKTPTNP